MTDTDRRRAAALAQLGLALGRRPPSGEPPTLEEIDAWRRGALPKADAERVQAFIAHDPDCYRQWRELIRAEEDLATERSVIETVKSPASPGLLARLNRWLKPGPAFGLAGALATVTFMAVLLLPLLKTPQLYEQVDARYDTWPGLTLTDDAWPWAVGSTKGLPDWLNPTAPPRPAWKQAIEAGMKQGLGQLTQPTPHWQRAKADLSDPPACGADAELGCEQRDALVQLGRAAVLWQLECAGDLSEQREREADRALLAVMADALAGFGMTELESSLAPWRRASTPSAFCAQTAGFIDQVLD